MLATVVTPVFNCVDRLPGCLESVAAQTHPDVEHIVIDGGSNDGTVDLLEQTSTRYVSEPDRGQTDAINKGFRLARGEVLTWLNGDDVLLPDAVSAVVDALDADPGAGWTYGDCIQREPDGRSWTVRPPRRIRADSFDGGNVLCQPGAFVTRWALERVGELDESLSLAMDYDLWLRLLAAGAKAVYVPRSLAVFEVHADSKTGSTNQGEFFREEALALLKGGRIQAASFAFGRSAAALERPVEEVAGDGELDPAAARAGQEMERAEQELRRGSPRGLLRLARQVVLGSPESRKRLRYLARIAWCRARSRGGSA